MTGAPPCDLQCETLFVNTAYQTHAYLAFYDMSGKSPRAIGKVNTYDGPYDPPSTSWSDAHTNWVDIDTSTTPPTLKVRRKRCVVGGASTDECPVTARLRYDGTKLANVKS